jgi:two-component system sensor histidine kinase HydH
MRALFDDLRRYIKFDDDATAVLARLPTLLEPELPGIVTAFYDAIDATPGAAAVISGPEVRHRLERSMLGWLRTGLAGPHDDAFLEARARIGKKHVQIRLPQHYMFTAMNVIRSGYHHAIHRLVAAGERKAAHRAIDQLLDLELALMLHTYKHDSEERLVRSERGAQDERVRSMQTLTAGLAHEVRNPLNAAKLQLELLERRLRRAEADARLVETTQVAHHEIERLTSLLNEFLAFARPPQLGAGEHDLRAIASQVLEAERPLADAAQVTLRLVSDETPVLAELDPGKVHQVVQNLVRNAIEAAAGRSSARVEVHVTSSPPGPDEGARLTVADTGAGIPEEVLAHIYEPFYSTKEGGTGMGMAIVHSLVSLHGGEITVSTGPHGTTFEVALRRRLR